jgi:20S proteasome subunit beta 7
MSTTTNPQLLVTAADPIRRTTRPIVTGSSVLGIVFDGGVLLAADTLLSYGGKAKHQGVSRMHTIGISSTVIAASGEFSDFQQLKKLLDQKCLEETQTSLTLMDSLYAADQHANTTLSAVTVRNYLCFIFYQKSNKFNPYCNDLVVAGLDHRINQPFLGSVDKLGTTVTHHVLAAGFGSYLALPLLREQWRPDLTEGQARGILDCCRVLFYRDCRASSQIQLAKCGVVGQEPLISAPYQLATEWSDPAFVAAAPAGLDGDGGW